MFVSILAAFKALSSRILSHVSLSLLLAAALWGCTFEANENFVAVDKTPKVELVSAKMKVVDLMTLPDTFEVFARTTNLAAAFDFKNKTLALVKLYIDDRFIKSFEGDSAQFSIYAPDYTDGLHAIRIETLTNSGTGSLADHNGDEVLQWEHTWMFVVKRAPIPQVKLTRTAPENGRLVIEWEASTVRTEKIVQLEYTQPYAGSKRWSYLITDPQQTRLVDSLFVEGNLKVTLTNQSIDPILESPTDVVTAQFNFPQIVSSTFDGVGNLTIKWNRSLFYKNVSKYSLSFDKFVLRSRDGSDTTFVTDKLPFWTSKTIVFKTRAKRLLWNLSDTTTLRIDMQLNVAEDLGHDMSRAIYAPLDPMLGFVVSGSKPQIQVLRGDVVMQSFETDTINLRSVSSMTISNHGEYLYMALNGKIIRVDRAGHGMFMMDTRKVYGKSLNVTQMTLGADRYLFFNEFTSATRYQGNFHMFDLQTSQSLWDQVDVDIDYYYNNTSFLQRSDGKFMVIFDRHKINLLTLDNGAIAKTVALTGMYNPMSSFFNTAFDNKLILADNASIEMHDLDAGEFASKSIAESVQYYITYQYDAVRGLVGFRVSGYYYLIDPTSGAILRKILIDPYTSTLLLHDGSLYAGSAKFDFHLD
jgi:hypothetical protein